jgi:phosphatidylinositol alpha-1,6-mannosyltransferase
VRYLVLTPDFPPGDGGVQTLLGVLAEGLAGRNDVRVVTPAASGDRAYDVTVTHPVSRYRAGATRAGKTLRLLISAARWVRGRDVIFCGHSAAAPVGWLLGLLFRKPFFVYVHASEITPPRYRRLFAFLLRRAKGIVTGSRYSRDLVVSYFGISPGDIDVINPAVAPGLTRAALEQARGYRLKSPDDKVVLSVGRLNGSVRYKGHDVVIEALPLVLRCVPRCYYWVVGSGDDVERLKASARREGVSEHVKFWGRVADVARFYRECDIFVMVSRRVVENASEKAEGFGLVFLEASLFGKPVIAGRCGGALDAVEDGRTGLLVDPESTAEVAAALVALLTCPVEARRLGTAGRERVLEDFTVQGQVSKVEAAVAGRIARAER